METTHLTDWSRHQLARKEFWESPVSLMASAEGPNHPAASALPAHCVCFATSGSTGQPSWIVLSKNSLLVSAAAVNRHLRVTSTSRWGLALPLHHVGGFGVVARVYQADCGFACFPGKWNATLFCAWLEENHITHTSLVPTQVHDLVSANISAPAPLAAVIVGGGRLPAVLGQAARDLGWPVLASYGMTEAASQVATQPLDTLSEKYLPDPLPPLDIWELQTANDGRLRIAGPALLSGWLRETGGNWSFSPRHDPWLTTNDIADLAPTGLRILGRADGLVKILGELVSPERIEADLTALSGIPLAVIALPDTRLQQRLIPVFENKTSLARANELLALHHASCPGYERLSPPAFIHSIPRTPLGKIRRKDLAIMLQAQSEPPT